MPAKDWLISLLKIGTLKCITPVTENGEPYPVADIFSHHDGPRSSEMAVENNIR
jgi:hypothetical protein